MKIQAVYENEYDGKETVYILAFIGDEKAVCARTVEKSLETGERHVELEELPLSTLTLVDQGYAQPRKTATF